MKNMKKLYLIGLLLVCIGALILGYLRPDTYTIQIYYNVDNGQNKQFEEVMIRETFSDFSLSDIKKEITLNQVESHDEADVLIMNKDKIDEFEKSIDMKLYDKIEMYSPLVMMSFNDKVASTSSKSFVENEEFKKSYAGYYNPKTYFEHLETEDDINIYIPSEKYNYDEELKKIIALSLSDGTLPTDQNENEKLNKRVENILNKCTRVKNYYDGFDFIFSKNQNDNEFVTDNSDSSMNKNYGDLFICPENIYAYSCKHEDVSLIYPKYQNKETVVEYVAYIKKNKAKQEALDIYIDTLKNSESYIKQIAIRIKDNDINYNDIYDEFCNYDYYK